MTSYKVLQRIQDGVLLRNGTMLTTVYFPKNEKPPGKNAEDLGVPSVITTEGGLRVNKLRIDTSGNMPWKGEPPDGHFTTGALEPRTKRQKALLENYQRGRKAREIIPTI